jgi:iron(III) transport system ATP-binding protein
LLKVESIRSHYDNQAVLEDVSFHVNQGDICCLLGPSGCGKTTALRAIAGFQTISHGQITLDNQLLSNNGFELEPEQRQIGMVFQDYALFPHLSVYENIRFGIRKLPSAEQRTIIGSLLSLIKLDNIAQRFPHELSGGQQQRVALARALAPNPRLLLLDEPFSNLDVDLRRHLNLEVRDILKQFGTSAILVTHDQEEAFAFGDHIGLLHDGKLQQWDSPFNLFHEPANRFVANFIGQGCLLPGMTINHNQIKTELGIITGNRAYHWSANTPVDVLLRLDDIVLDVNAGINSEIIKKVFSGSATLYSLRLPTGSMVESLLSSHHDFNVGDHIKIQAKVEHLIAFTPEEL